MSNNPQQIVPVVYFLEREDGAIKIGTTVDFNKRLYALVLEHGKLRVLGLISGSYQKETDLHQRFSSVKIKGEWFEACQELFDFIAKNTNRTTQQPWIDRTHFQSEGRKPSSRKKREYINNIPVLIAQKQVRDRKRYKQKEISQLSGISQSMVSRTLTDKIDIGQMKYGEAEKWADWLGCKMNDLLTEIESRN